MNISFGSVDGIQVFKYFHFVSFKDNISENCHRLLFNTMKIWCMKCPFIWHFDEFMKIFEMHFKQITIIALKVNQKSSNKPIIKWLILTKLRNYPVIITFTQQNWSNNINKEEKNDYYYSVVGSYITDVMSFCAFHKARLNTEDHSEPFHSLKKVVWMIIPGNARFPQRMCFFKKDSDAMIQHYNNNKIHTKHKTQHINWFKTQFYERNMHQYIVFDNEIILRRFNFYSFHSVFLLKITHFHHWLCSFLFWKFEVMIKL